MQFHAGMIGARKAAAAQAAGGHVEIAAVLLHHNVAGHFGSAEKGMLALVDGKIFGDAVCERGVGIIPAGFELLERDTIGTVAVDLVGGHVDKRRFGTGPPRRFQHVQRAQGIHLKIQKRNGGGAVVRGLGGRVHDQVRFEPGNKRKQLFAVADVDGRMAIIGDLPLQQGEHPAGVALRPEKHRAVITVDAGNAESLAGEKHRHGGADEAAGAGNQYGRLGHQYLSSAKRVWVGNQPAIFRLRPRRSET